MSFTRTRIAHGPLRFRTRPWVAHTDLLDFLWSSMVMVSKVITAQPVRARMSERRLALNNYWYSSYEYIAHRAVLCPQCKSDDIGAGPIEADDGGWGAFCRVECVTCGFHWHDEYTLTGYSPSYLYDR